MLERFNNVSFRAKIAWMAFGFVVPIMLMGTAYFTWRVYQLTVVTAVNGLMNFVDGKQQGVIRFLGQNEKLAKELAILVEGGNQDHVERFFSAIVEVDRFKIEDHPFKDEISSGKRPIPTMHVYHAIDYVQDGVIALSSDPGRKGSRLSHIPDLRHGYSDVWKDGDRIILSFGAKAGAGMVYI
ncbi:hypothetical protein, partial [Magnetospirillum sp. SS-4]|uniref:hypothetical protein n=1 Tax=Magnetospirillum sp. SS-4 TaxID=2681465 RepID=UPI001C2D54CA